MPQCVTRPRNSDLTRMFGFKLDFISAPVTGDVTGRPSAISRYSGAGARHEAHIP
jgi:hypothetical protein